MRKGLSKTFVVLIMLLSLSSIAYSSTTENGISWLYSTQNIDGSWGNDADTKVLDTSTVLDTMKYLNVSNSAYSNGIAWLASQYPPSTDFVSRKIVGLHMAGVDVSVDLSTLINSKNSDGGWGGDGDSTNMMNDTALALQALKTVNYSDQTVIQSAIEYLLSTQNPDGGFGFYSGDESNVYMTAIVSSTLQQFPQTTSIATAINKATSYLIAHQNTDGVLPFGTHPIYFIVMPFGTHPIYFIDTRRNNR
jgi:prenyltransferase beta subunit